MKNTILAIAFLALLVGISACAENNIQGQATTGTCTDTDGGPNYYLKGTLTFNSKEVYNDSCNAQGKLNELYCVMNNTGYTSTVYTCPGTCVNGACVNQTNTTNNTRYLNIASVPPNATVKLKPQSGSARNIGNTPTQGYLKYNLDAGGFPIGTYTLTLDKSGYNSYSKSVYLGPTSWTGSVTLNQTTFCFDSDGGTYAGIAGYINSTATGYKKDTCVGVKNILEGYCVPNSPTGNGVILNTSCGTKNCTTNVTSGMARCA